MDLRLVRLFLAMVLFVMACGHESTPNVNTEDKRVEACYVLMDTGLSLEFLKFKIEGIEGYYVWSINQTTAEEEFIAHNTNYVLAEDEEVFWDFTEIGTDQVRTPIVVPLCEYVPTEGSTVEIRAVTSRTFTP